MGYMLTLGQRADGSGWEKQQFTTPDAGSIVSATTGQTPVCMPLSTGSEFVPNNDGQASGSHALVGGDIEGGRMEINEYVMVGYDQEPRSGSGTATIKEEKTEDGKAGDGA